MPQAFVAGLSLVLLTLSSSSVALAQLSADEIVSRSKPAVFKLVTAVDIDVRCPVMKVPVGVSTDYDVARRNGQTDLPETTYVWARIASDPAHTLEPAYIGRAWRAQYYKPSDPEFTFKIPLKITKSFRDAPFASGSGFAVSQDGIILTNAHVVAPPGRGELKQLVGSLMIGDVFENLIQEVGAMPPENGEFRDKLVKSVWDWLAPACEANLKRTWVRVITKRAVLLRPPQNYLPDFTKIFPQHVQPPSKPADTIPPDTLSEFSEPLTPLKSRVGEVWPGKDVAVLAWKDPPDGLISLPLGDSDNFNNPVHSMGFPSVVSNEPALRENEESPRVITHDGGIYQKVQTIKDWFAFHTSADINHGDSGGPILDATGKVVALNVAGNQVNETSGTAPGNNFAIPINIAKEFLAGLKLDPGPKTEYWFSAENAYWQKRYARALRLIRKLTSPYSPEDWAVRPKNDVYGYVHDLAVECEKMIKEGKDQSTMFDKYGPIS